MPAPATHLTDTLPMPKDIMLVMPKAGPKLRVLTFDVVVAKGEKPYFFIAQDDQQFAHDGAAEGCVLCPLEACGGFKSTVPPHERVSPAVMVHPEQRVRFRWDRASSLWRLTIAPRDAGALFAVSDVEIDETIWRSVCGAIEMAGGAR